MTGLLQLRGCRLTTRATCLVIAGLVLFLSQGFTAEAQRIDTAIEQSLAWVRAHPATCEDGGFADILDEGLFYLTVNRLARQTRPELVAEQPVYDCIARLEAAPGFTRGVEKPNKSLIEHYHLLLATHIIEQFRQPLASREAIIGQARRTLANSRFEHPTFRLTVAMLIRQLGADPGVDPDALLEASLVNHISRADAAPLRQSFVFYALVHEVAVLTDFGQLPPIPWLLERRNRIGKVLQKGIHHATRSLNIDLLAEIILCHEMLDLPMGEDVAAGVDYLLAQQQQDGTWGVQMTARANPTRHAVQTATAALLAYRIRASKP